MDWLWLLLGVGWKDIMSIPSWMIYILRVLFLVLLFNIGQIVYETSMPIVLNVSDDIGAIPMGHIAFFENITSIQINDTILFTKDSKLAVSERPMQTKEHLQYVMNNKEIRIYGRLFYSIRYIGYIQLLLTNIEYKMNRLIIALVIAISGCGILGTAITNAHSKLWSFVLAFLAGFLWCWIYIGILIKFEGIQTCNNKMRSPPEQAMRNSHDIEEPRCSCIVCVNTSTIIYIASSIEIIFGGLILPIFIICFWLGIISSNFFMTNGLSVTIFFILLTKCILMVVNGAIGITAVKDKSITLMIIFLICIGLRCIFQIVLMSLKQYEAVIELFIWICLGFEFSRYYKYLKIISSDVSYQPIQ